MPVRYIAGVDPKRHALAVSCADPASCAVALQRLRADSAHFAEVVIDERKTAR